MHGPLRVPLALTGPALASLLALSACSTSAPTASRAPDASVTATVTATVGACAPPPTTGDPLAARIAASRVLVLAATPPDLPADARAVVDALVAELAALASAAERAEPADQGPLVILLDDAFRRAAEAERSLDRPIAWRPPRCGAS